jgi:Flp pilus assembly protein TadG
VLSSLYTVAPSPRDVGMFSNKHKGHFDRGAAAVEMALVLPLLLLVLFGLVDFGRAFNDQMQLTQAAREAVRLIALGGSQPDADARAKLAMPAAGDRPAPAVTAWTLCAPGSTGIGTVTVQSTFKFLTPLGPIASWFGASTLPGVGDVKTLAAEGAMRCAG